MTCSILHFTPSCYIARAGVGAALSWLQQLHSTVICGLVISFRASGRAVVSLSLYLCKKYDDFEHSLSPREPFMSGFEAQRKMRRTCPTRYAWYRRAPHPSSTDVRRRLPACTSVRKWNVQYVIDGCCCACVRHLVVPRWRLSLRRSTIHVFALSLTDEIMTCVSGVNSGLSPNAYTLHPKTDHRCSPCSAPALLLYPTGRSAAFVVRPPLAAGSHRVTSQRMVTSLSRTSLPGDAGARDPWTCLAPGGKVGKQKVSLDRAVTSITKPKPEQQPEQKASHLRCAVLTTYCCGAHINLNAVASSATSSAVECQ